MLEMESSKPPQITEMFQKFAIAFKEKTFEFFTEDDANSTTATDTEDGFALLDSTEDFITDQKVIIIKPDPTKKDPMVIQPFNSQFGEYLISSLFATISSFEASYLQLQTAHVPFDEEGIKINDRALISQLQKLYDLREMYVNSRRNPDFNVDFTIGLPCLEAQVQENQNKLRALETMFNRLQSDIDAKDDKVLVLRKKLDEIQQFNSKLSMKMSKNLKLNSNSSSPIPNGFLLTIRVFDSMLREARRSTHFFTKLLIELMKKAGWDLDLAADYVHTNVEYAKKGHKLYAFLSYVCLGMFRGFDCESFGLVGNDKSVCNGDALSEGKNDSLMQLFEHVSVNPVETLNRNPICAFSKFCETKYEELVHPTVESSIFSNLDRKEAVLDSCRSLSVFYEAFVNMSSSIWLLHKLAYSLNPTVEIFQVERGVDFSMVYMEDVTRRGTLLGKSRPKVGFTVVPGFKVGTTIIQSQVYLTGSKCTA